MLGEASDIDSYIKINNRNLRANVQGPHDYDSSNFSIGVHKRVIFFLSLRLAFFRMMLREIFMLSPCHIEHTLTFRRISTSEIRSVV